MYLIVLVSTRRLQSVVDVPGTSIKSGGGLNQDNSNCRFLKQAPPPSSATKELTNCETVRLEFRSYVT